MPADDEIARDNNEHRKCIDPEWLEALYGVELSWNRVPDVPDGSAAARLRHYLEQSAKPSTELRQKMPNSGAMNARRPRSRPRALSWVEERKIAIFIEMRRLDKRHVKNATVDVSAKFNISRATAFRILKKHRAGAQFMACALKKAGRKRFIKGIQIPKRISRPDFSDWGPDRY